MKKFFRFFISKQFLFNVLAIIIVWVAIVLFEMYYLKSHTNFGQQIEVPTFYKIHMDDLDEFVKDKGISYTIQDSVYLDDWPKGTVCWQHPKPTDSTGMHVKEGREILLSVVPVNPQMIKVPNVVDMSKRMGEKALESLGFRVKVSYKPHPYDAGFIMEQLQNGNPIAPGTSVPKGSRLELVVSQGKTGEVSSLPNLIGLTISEAKERLSNLTLSLFPDCETCQTEEDFLNAVITDQNPKGGEGVSVSAGTTVTIWATKASN